MQMMIRLHFFAVLFLIAAIPFTFMRHAVASPLNVFYRKQGARAALTQPSIESGEIGARTVNDLTWKQMLDADACVACGRCDENCPAAISGKPLSPRKIIRNIREQMETVGTDQKHRSQKQGTHRRCWKMSSPRMKCGPAPPAWPVWNIVRSLSNPWIRSSTCGGIR